MVGVCFLRREGGGGGGGGRKGIHRTIIKHRARGEAAFTIQSTFGVPHRGLSLVLANPLSIKGHEQGDERCRKKVGRTTRTGSYSLPEASAI